MDRTEKILARAAADARILELGPLVLHWTMRRELQDQIATWAEPAPKLAPASAAA